LFSSFPTGSAGLGLLVLRVTVGAATLGQGLLHVVGPAPSDAFYLTLDAASILSGGALLAGALTPAAAVLAALAALGRALVTGAPGMLQGLESGAALVLLMVMGVAVALLGPGAHSVDALLFGRREIVVPRGPHEGAR
jgi:uncharacterized membrane protein YphA (DoxX/SURF4 family)